MKRFALLGIVTALTLLLAACGSRGADEAELPTPVPVFTRAVSADATPAADAETASGTESADAVALTDTDTAAEEAPAAAEGDATESPSADTAPVDEPAAEEPAAAEPTAAEPTAAEPTAAEAVAEATAAEEPADEDAVDEETATPEPTATTAATATALPTATVAPTATAAPTATTAPTATPEPASAADDPLAGVPESIAALLPAADVARGEQLVLTNACIGCHNLDPGIPMAGPTWYNVAETAATRVEGETAATYLYNSIIHPNDYVVEGYAPGVMLQTYGDLPEQDLADLLAYLLTLKGME